jgi:hypothetical protein
LLGVKKLIFHNFGLKFFALSLALLLEFYFYSPDNSVTKSYAALIRFKNLPSTMMIVEPPNARYGIEAEIQLRGPKPLVEQVSAKISEINIDAPLSLLPGEFPLRVNPGELTVPSGVEVIQIAPVTSRVRVEEREGKELIVVAETVGEPADGYMLKGLEVFPDTVVARGPKSRIEQLAAIETLTVDVSDLKASFKTELSIKQEDPMIDVGVTLVTVDVIIVPKQAKRQFEEVRVRLLAPKGYAATIEGSTKAKVTLSGPQKILDEISLERLELSVDATQLGAGFYQVPITGTFPEGVSLLEVWPKSLGITIRGENGETVRN